MIEQALWAVALPVGCMAGVIALVVLLPPLRVKAGIADGVLALCLPGAAIGTFIVEKGLPTLPPEQKWLILPWILLAGGLLGLVLTSIGGRKYPGLMALIGAAVAGTCTGLWLVLPDLDSIDARITLGLQLGLAVLVVAGVMRQGRPVLTCIALWAAGAALSVTLLSSANITLALAAGAVSATSATAGLLLAIGAKKAPHARLGVGAALGVTCVLVMLMLVGQIYDNSSDGIAGWRWWLTIVGPGVLLLVPFATTKGRLAVAFAGVLTPAVVTGWLAASELMALDPTGY